MKLLDYIHFYISEGTEMKIADLDNITRLVLFRAKMVTQHNGNRDDLEKLKEAQDQWETAHAEEILQNIFKAINTCEIDENEEECDRCDGTGLIGNRIDGNSCPKCKGVGVVTKTLPS